MSTESKNQQTTGRKRPGRGPGSGKKDQQGKSGQQKLGINSNGGDPENNAEAAFLSQFEDGADAEQGTKNNTTGNSPTVLPVEIHFDEIFDLKQKMEMDNKGFLVLQLGFKVKLQQDFELFRLANLLRQKGTRMFATLGCNQAAMDFSYDPDGQTFRLILPGEVSTAEEETAPAPEIDGTPAGSGGEEPPAPSPDEDSETVDKEGE